MPGVADARWLEDGHTEADLGIDRLRETGRRVLGDGTAVWHVGYRVRVGVV